MYVGHALGIGMWDAGKRKLLVHGHGLYAVIQLDCNPQPN